MKPRMIKNDQEYETMLNWIDEQFDKKPDPNSDEGNVLQIALLTVKAYEDVHHPVPSPDR